MAGMPLGLGQMRGHRLLGPRLGKDTTATGCTGTFIPGCIRLDQRLVRVMDPGLARIRTIRSFSRSTTWLPC